MSKFLKPMISQGKRKFVGREDIIDSIFANLNRNEISNVSLVANPGTGKTSTVMKMVDQVPQWHFLEVKLSSMARGTNGKAEMPDRLTQLFDEVHDYQLKTAQTLVLFMDEFHVLMELSKAAAEAIKPILANSGRRGIRIIVATTYDEYDKYIRNNQALNERLEAIKLPDLSREETLVALRNYCKAYIPSTVQLSDRFLMRIIKITDESLPSQKQPRKSLRLLDALDGWRKAFGTKIDDDLLAKITKLSLGVDIKRTWNVNAIKSYFDQRVLDQTLATTAVTNRLWISQAHLNDPTRPKASFLFLGPTGVGKTELAKALANRIYGADSKMTRFDMSEYSRNDSVDLFRNRLTMAAWESPSCVLLLDEFEKASPDVLYLMYQVLDDARLTDEHGKIMSFKDMIVVMTSNAGEQVYDEMSKQFGSAAKVDPKTQQDMLKKFYDLVYRRVQSKNGASEGIPPALLGRIDMVVPFAPIAIDTRTKIARYQLQKLATNVWNQFHVQLHFDKKIEQYIVLEHLGTNNANAGGGRTVRRRIDQEITGKVAEAVLTYPNVKHLAVSISGRLATGNKFDRKGSADVIVGSWAGNL